MEVKLAQKGNSDGIKLTADQVKSCIELYTKGMPIIHISNQLGITQNMITGALRRNKVKIYPRNTRKTQEFSSHESLIQDYTNGKSLIQLSSAYSLGTQTIKRIIVKNGLYRTPGNQKVIMSDEHLLIAINLAKQGMAYKDIGIQLGYSVWVINRSLVTAGITRPKGQANLTNYQAHVRRLTIINYNKYKNLINPNNLPRGKKSYHIDHIYSVYDGFTNNISAEVISHPANLQMLPSSENIIKRTKSHHTFAELMEKIKNFPG